MQPLAHTLGQRIGGAAGPNRPTVGGGLTITLSRRAWRRSGPSLGELLLDRRMKAVDQAGIDSSLREVLQDLKVVDRLRAVSQGDAQRSITDRINRRDGGSTLGAKERDYLPRN